MISILTPTYNRYETLRRAYNSLTRQTNNEFEWVIIDDGSKDDTKKLIYSFIKEKKIRIKYFYKKNGGKHTAINFGLSKVSGDSLLILDSDDYLVDDAIEIVYSYQKKYWNNPNIAALSFLKIYDSGDSIGKKFVGDEIISDNISFRYNKGILGDMGEVYKTDILKKYPFPQFDNEKFLSEAIIWNRIAFDYKTVYINKGIYIVEYLPNGLSSKSLELRYHNPYGACENAKLFLNSRFKIIIRIKNAILYDCFYLISKRKKNSIIYKKSFFTLAFFPAGFLLKLLLDFKCKKQK